MTTLYLPNKYYVNNGRQKKYYYTSKIILTLYLFGLYVGETTYSLSGGCLNADRGYLKGLECFPAVALEVFLIGVENELSISGSEGIEDDSFASDSDSAESKCTSSV